MSKPAPPTRSHWQRHAVWPRQTAAPSVPIPSNSKRRSALRPRQTIADMSSVVRAETQCQLDSGNEIISCYPTTGVSVSQEEWASFVWNSRRPEITQTNLVDIFLFRADSSEQILHFPNVTNPSDQAGLLRTKVNDTWFGADGLSWAGSNLTFPYCWVLIRSDRTLDGSQISQSVFSAVQTTVLDSVASSSSASAASSSSSARAASLSSSLNSASAAESSSTGNVQHASSASPFPHWAIAVIVVLGFLAIAASCILVFFILRRLRRRREKDSNRNSMGSSSPMIARDSTRDMVQTYDSPPLPAHTGIPSTTTGISPLIPAGNLTTDAASTTSDGGGALSGADAAIIAEAFRKKLRKPDFAVRSVDEGDSPDTTGERERETEAAGNVVLSRELAEEGRDIRYVSSSKGVKVESSQS